MDHRAALLALAEAYGAATGRSLSRVATLCANHGHFFVRIQAGGGFSIDRFDRIVQWFADNWPSGTDWPAGVVRPAARTNPQEAA